MDFRTLTVENFLSHAQSTVNLHNRGLVLLRGEVVESDVFDSNGAGKSSLLPDGILFALFGRTSRGIKGPAVVRREAGRDCAVHLGLTLDDATDVTIIRTQRHRTTPKSTITVGAETYTGEAEINRVVEEHFGLHFQTFNRTIVYSRGQSFLSLDDGDRKSIFDDILSFDEIAAFAERTAEAVRTWTTYREELQRNAFGIRKQLEVIDADIAGAAREAEDEARAAKAEAKRQAETVAAAQEAVREHDRKAKAAASLLKRLGGQLDAADATVQQLQALAPEREQAYATANETAAQARAEAARTGGDLRAFQQLETGAVCPTCRQRIAAAHRRACLKDLEEKAKRAAEVYESARAVVTDAKLTMDKFVQELRDAERSYRGLREDKLVAQNDLDHERRAGEQAAVRVAEEQRRAARPRPQRAVSALKEKRAAAADAATRLTLVEQELRTWEQHQPYLDFWTRGFSNQGFRSWLLDVWTPWMNERAAHYTELLTGGELHVEFATQTPLKDGRMAEKFNCIVRRQQGGETYDGCSMGEQCRADIVTAFVLGDLAARRLNSPINLAVLDEIMDGLDPAGVAQTFAVLQDLVQRRSSVFVVTHNPLLQDVFDTVITVRKEGGVSRVV